MRTALLLVALVASGCATINRSGGAGGAEVVSGEARTEASETGAATNSVATNGSDSPDPSPQHPGPPAHE